MKITGIDGLTVAQVRDEVSQGAKFVVFSYVISLLIVTLRRSSDITFVPAGKSPVVAGLGWTALTLALGWWGFPWGFIYTPVAVVQNLGGGKDVTAEVLSAIEQGP